MLQVIFAAVLCLGSGVSLALDTLVQDDHSQGLTVPSRLGTGAYAVPSIVSGNGQYTLVMQDDGNVVIYGPGEALTVCRGICCNQGDRPHTLILQTDGMYTEEL